MKKIKFRTMWVAIICMVVVSEAMYAQSLKITGFVRDILDDSPLIGCSVSVENIPRGIIEYKGVRCVGSHWRGGTHRIYLPMSNLIREFRDITMHKINGMEVYL